MDFDGDGRDDVISGSYPGELYLFKGEGDGKFAAAEQLKHADGKPIKLGFAAVAYAHDWDGDKDLDLLVGDIEGRVHLVPNDGARDKTSYGKASLLQAGGAPLKVNHGDAGPTVADWDGDGKFDLLVGNGAGGVVWFRNTGTDAAPQLAAAQVLVPDVMGEGGAVQEGAKRGTRAKVHAADWNKDGKLDLLVGDFAMKDANAPAPDPAEQAKRDAERQEWMKEYDALQQAPVGETKEARQARMKRMGDLIARFRAANAAAQPQQQPSKYHGYVWLFLREGRVANAE